MMRANSDRDGVACRPCHTPHAYTGAATAGRPYRPPPVVLMIAFLFIITGGAGRGLSAPTELVVAADGTGQYKTVQEAVMVVPSGSPANPVVIRIKPGTYRELIYVQREKRFFHLLGEDAAKTILTYDLNANIVGRDGKP